MGREDYFKRQFLPFISFEIKFGNAISFALCVWVFFSKIKVFGSQAVLHIGSLLGRFN